MNFQIQKNKFLVQIATSLTIVLNNTVRVSRSGITLQLVNFLREELNFANAVFIIKKKIVRNTFGRERYFKFVEETENEIIVPRGFVGKATLQSPTQYLFLNQKRKLGLIKKMKKQITKFEISGYDLGSETLNSST